MSKKLLITTLLVLQAFANPLAAQELLGAVAAIVGDKAILLSEVNQLAQLMATQERQDLAENSAALPRYQQKALEELIDQQIILAYAKQETLEVEDRQVRQRLEEVLRNLEQQYGSLKNATTLFGVSERKLKEFYRQQIHDNLVIEKVKQELFSKLKVSRREVEEFFQTYRDSFPPTPPQVDFSVLSLTVKPRKARELAVRDSLLELKKNIENGLISFAQAARLYSQDRGSAQAGGLLGFVGKGVLVKPFEKAAFSLPLNTISEPVRTQYGWHLIYVTGRQGDKVQVHHILRKVVPDSVDYNLTRERLLAIRDSIESGLMNFVTAVKKYSSDENLRFQGGRVGLMAENSLPLKIRQTLDSLPLEVLSDPVQTGNQFHLLLVHRRVAGGSLSLEKDWATIENAALQKKRQDRFRKWIESQKKRFYIHITEGIFSQ